MKQWIAIVFFTTFCNFCCNGQKNIPHFSCQNPVFDKKVKNMLSFNVPTVDIDFANKNKDNLIFLDARALEEYQTSHIKNAKYIGFNNFDVSVLKDVTKESKIIVYCSIGYRSEIIAKKIIDLGYRNVFNLYGSIFEWCNHGLPIYDMNNNLTLNLHTYNRKWSQYVYNQQIIKKW